MRKKEEVKQHGVWRWGGRTTDGHRLRNLILIMWVMPVLSLKGSRYRKDRLMSVCLNTSAAKRSFWKRSGLDGEPLVMDHYL